MLKFISVVIVAAALLGKESRYPLAAALSPSVPSTATRRSFLQKPFSTLATVVIGATLLPNDAQAAIAGPSSVSDGMAAFAAGEIDRSIEIYDSIILAEPQRRPYLWQRGLSLYYAERYRDGAEQFAADVAVNPNDTEEQIWHLLCLARLEGSLEKARPLRLTVGRDRRPVMRVVQSLFLAGGETSERDLVELADNGDVGSRFYAKMYLSLYYESLGNVGEAENWMTQAVGTDYAKNSGRRDPMVELAKVAVSKRGWSTMAAK